MTKSKKTNQADSSNCQVERMVMHRCPICNKEVDTYYEIAVSKPFIAYSPMEGLTVWGPYDCPKKVICQNKHFVHFQFRNIETRLVKMTGA